MISPRDLFLRQHPELAKRVAAGKGVKKFLDNHGGIAAGWQRVMNAREPTLADPRDAPTPAPPPPAPAANPAASAAAATQAKEAASAKAAITGSLAAYGLQGLGEWAWNEYLSGKPPEQIMLDMRGTPEYAARFPGMKALAAKGRAIDEGTYIQAERSYKQQMRDAGLPADFYDSADDFTKLIENDVSAKEFGERLQLAQQAALTSPQGEQMRHELTSRYGITNSIGAVTAYFIDPDRASTLLKQQFAAAQVAGESVTTGFGSLTTPQAERIAGAGVSVDQARQGFSTLAGMGELNDGLLGDSGDQGVTRDEMIDAAFTGDAAAKQKVERTARRRVASFEGGGSFAAGERGVSGLGSASS